MQNDSLNRASGINTVSYSTTSDAQGNQNIILSERRTEISSGPLPHPELLKGYDEVIKDGAERIMKMAEREQEKPAEKGRIKNFIFP